MNDNSTKIFLGIIAACLVFGSVYWFLAPKPESTQSFGSAMGAVNVFSSTTNTSVKVGLNSGVSTTVVSADNQRGYFTACNNGIGLVTVCLSANCTFGSGLTLGTSTMPMCLTLDGQGMYQGTITAAVSATTSPSVTSTLGVVVGD